MANNNKKIIIKIAEKKVLIKSCYLDLKSFFRLYKIDTTSYDFEIIMNEKDIQNEANNGTIKHLSDSYYESLALYRKLSTKFIEYNTFLFHGSAICVDNKAYIFTGKSGTGKSTHAYLWRKLLGNKAFMINDDKPLIKNKDEKSFVYGTPWDGKHQLSTNTSSQIKAICILEQGTNNNIKELNKEDAFINIYKQTFKPNNKEKLFLTINLIEQLLQNVKVYKMICNMEQEAAEIAYNGMK